MFNPYTLAAMADFKIGQARKAVRRDAEAALSGAVSIEYVLIAGLIAVAIITALTLLGGALDGKLDLITEQIEKMSITPGTPGTAGA